MGTASDLIRLPLKSHSLKPAEGAGRPSLLHDLRCSSHASQVQTSHSPVSPASSVSFSSFLSLLPRHRYPLPSLCLHSLQGPRGASYSEGYTLGLCSTTLGTAQSQGMGKPKRMAGGGVLWPWFLACQPVYLLPRLMKTK